MIPLGEIIKLQGYPVSIAENDPNSDVLTATVCICDFYTNANGVRLNRETIDNWLSTLIDKPLVGKLRIKPNGTEDFTSHNVTRSVEVDENGDEHIDYILDTSAFGTFTDARIETVNGNEYITATAVIWKRFKNACATILRRIDDGTLSTSWEIQVKKSHHEIEDSEPVKVIDDGIFIGHALLGEDVAPAYDCSRLLDCASASDETLIAAIIRDFFADDSDIKNSEKGGKVVDDIKELEVTEQENSEAVEVEESKAENEESAQETVQETVQDETVETVSESEESSEAEVETEETAEQEVVEQRDYEKELSDKDDALIKANETIESLKEQIAQLMEIKSKYDAIIAEENQKKHDAEVEQLKSYVIKSNRFSAEEIASEPISTMISELKTIELKAMIADRIVESITENVLPDVSESQSNQIKVNISAIPSDASASDIMRNFFDD